MTQPPSSPLKPAPLMARITKGRRCNLCPQRARSRRQVAMRSSLQAGLFAGAALLAWQGGGLPGTSPIAFAEPTGTNAPQAGLVEITAESKQAVAQGLAYLAASQQPDGSWGSMGASDPGKYPRHVGITSLGVIAFLADGHLPNRGPYGTTVARGLDFVLSQASASGLVAADVSHGPMYGHGFATLMLGEVYGMTRDPRVREALLKAVRLIVESQNQEGGWRYNPGDLDADISVTICQVMALRSAKNAGIYVPNETIEHAIEYVRNCQNETDGGFKYMIGSGSSLFPRSAAGVATMYYAGIYDDEVLDKGLAYLENLQDPIGNQGGHYYYGHYYAAQAMYLAGGEHWANWYPAIRDTLIKNQQPDGSWQSMSVGQPYATAMSLIVMQMPNRLLPIFQR